MKYNYIITLLAVLALPNFASAKATDQPVTSTAESAAVATAGEEGKIFGLESSSVEKMAKDDKEEKDDEKDDDKDEKEEKKGGGDEAKLLGHASAGVQLMEKDDDKEEKDDEKDDDKDDDKDEKGEH